MTFFDPKLPLILEKLHQLDPDRQPQWGSMSAQRMVEHLSDSVRLGFVPHNFPAQIPEEKFPRAQAFIESEHPMPRDFKVEFATPETPLRHEKMTDSIQEFENNWKAFQQHYSEHPDATAFHPSFGHLTYDQWMRVHAKHFTHHFEQFGLL